MCRFSQNHMSLYKNYQCWSASKWMCIIPQSLWENISSKRHPFKKFFGERNVQNGQHQLLEHLAPEVRSKHLHKNARHGHTQSCNLGACEMQREEVGSSQVPCSDRPHFKLGMLYQNTHYIPLASASSQETHI